MNPDIGTNPTMLRAMAMNLETLLKQANVMPEYLRKSSAQFVEDLKRYASEIEEAQKKIVTV